MADGRAAGRRARRRCRAPDRADPGRRRAAPARPPRGGPASPRFREPARARAAAPPHPFPRQRRRRSRTSGSRTSGTRTGGQADRTWPHSASCDRGTSDSPGRPARMPRSRPRRRRPRPPGTSPRSVRARRECTSCVKNALSRAVEANSEELFGLRRPGRRREHPTCAPPEVAEVDPPLLRGGGEPLGEVERLVQEHRVTGLVTHVVEDRALGARRDHRPPRRPRSRPVCACRLPDRRRRSARARRSCRRARTCRSRGRPCAPSTSPDYDAASRRTRTRSSRARSRTAVGETVGTTCVSDSRIVKSRGRARLGEGCRVGERDVLVRAGDDELDRRGDLAGDGERRQRLHAGSKRLRQRGEELVETVRVLVREQRDGGACRIPEAVSRATYAGRRAARTVVLEREQVRAERSPVVTGLEAGDHGAGDDEPEEVARSEPRTSASPSRWTSVVMERIASETSFNGARARTSEIRSARLRSAADSKRERRSSRHPYESDATARDIRPRDHFLDRSSALALWRPASALRRAGPRARRGSPNGRPPRGRARSRGAPDACAHAASRRERARSPARARSSPGPVDERRQSGHERVFLAHVPGEHASDATEHGPVVRGSEPERKPSLGAGERAPCRRASTHVRGRELRPRRRAAAASWRAPPGGR